MCKIRGVWLRRPLPSLNTDATSPMEMWLAYHFQSCECGLGRGRGRSNTLPLWAPSSREQAASASSLLKPECHAVRKPTRLPGQAYVGDEGGSQPRERAIWRVDSPGSPPSPPPRCRVQLGNAPSHTAHERPNWDRINDGCFQLLPRGWSATRR